MAEGKGKQENVFGGSAASHRFFKKLVCHTFYAHCEVGLYLLKFYLLDHFLEAVDWFDIPQLLETSGFERNNVHIHIAYVLTSKQHSSGIEECVRETESRSTP